MSKDVIYRDPKKCKRIGLLDNIPWHRRLPGRFRYYWHYLTNKKIRNVMRRGQEIVKMLDEAGCLQKKNRKS